MSDGYIHKKNLVYKNQFHIIFCPKYRKSILIRDIEKRLREILYEEDTKINV